MKAILELKKERDEGSIFYRYNISGTQVWFEQYQDSGNIYMTHVRLNDELAEDFKFYVQDHSYNEEYYPESIEINTNHERMTVDHVEGYIDRLRAAKEAAIAIMEIFESGIHKELYEHYHK